MNRHFVFFGCLALGGLPCVASAQTKEELALARKTFAEALQEEQAGNVREALAKYEAVKAVKDTAPVRFRMAGCYEKLGQLKRARAEYEEAILRGQADQTQADVVKASKENLEKVRARIPELLVRLSGHSPPDTEVRLDGETLAANRLGTGIQVDPGAHKVQASANDAIPFETEFSLPEGSHFSVLVNVEARPQQLQGSAPQNGPTAPSVPERGSWLPWALGTSGLALALVGTSTALFVSRSAAIDSLHEACPNNTCPRSRQDELTPIHDRAVSQGPAAGITLGVGLAALGVSSYLWFRHFDSKRSSVSAWSVGPGSIQGAF